MRSSRFLCPALLVGALVGTLVLGSGVARGDVPAGWHSSLKAGVEAAAKSGKPILLITAWKRTL